MSFVDAHNHLQDPRLAESDALLAQCRALGITNMVVNGTREEDWPRVRDLAQRHPDLVRPSFGLHPWHVAAASAQWKEILAGLLDQASGVGEIGLDLWMRDPDLPRQKEAFEWQWLAACQRGLPISIHCLRAWGHLQEMLQRLPRAPRGFLLHSYGGSSELARVFAKLGAYFSFSGYFLHERKTERRAVFLTIPRERWLLETDAPDMALPETARRFGDAEANHPANLLVIYEASSRLLGIPPEAWAEQIARNYRRLFGPENSV